jgi:tetraprenyl-beta-curcumene synthase
VFPQVRRERRYWRARAEWIPDPCLRRLALETYRCKWLNVEGAAAFAVFAPVVNRQTTVTALVTYQTAYDYADTLAELPTTDPVANGFSLHQPLITALEPDLEHPDYYAHSYLKKDGGYLQALTDACRTAFQRLPCHRLVKDAVERASTRIITYQCLNHGDAGARQQLEEWAQRQTPSGSGLTWWETAAACASSLNALALISAAAATKVSRVELAEIESAYHPWIGALHTLLDSLIDWGEDECVRQPSLLDNYSSSNELVERMRLLAVNSRLATTTLAHPAFHAALLAGMVSVYLTAPEARTAYAAPVADAVLAETGPLTCPSLAVLRVRRRLRRTQTCSRHEPS